MELVDVDVTVAEVTVLVVEEMLDVVIVELVVELVVVEVEDVVVVEVVEEEVLVVELVDDDVLEVVVVVVVETMHVDSLWAMVTIVMGAKAELYENRTGSADSLMLNSTPVMSPPDFLSGFRSGTGFRPPCTGRPTALAIGCWCRGSG